MRVTFAKTPTFDEIFADADFIALREKFRDEELVRQFVPSVIKIFSGTLVGPDSFERYATFWSQSHRTSDPNTPAVVAEAARLLQRLHASWADHLGELRGALVEGLVLARLGSRYTGHKLEDNSHVTVTNGLNFTSSRTIDVSGWDGNRGECHDCKVRAKKVDLTLVHELEDNLPEPEFKIGVVATDSRLVMTDALRTLGYSPTSQTTLIPLEELWDLAPLQKTSS